MPPAMSAEEIEAELEVLYRLVAVRMVCEAFTSGRLEWTPEMLRSLHRLLEWAELHSRRTRADVT